MTNTNVNGNTENSTKSANTTTLSLEERNQQLLLKMKGEGLSPVELQEAIDISYELLEKAQIQKAEVQGGAVKDDEKQIGKLRGAWNWSWSKAKAVWNAIVEFFCMLGRLVVDAWKNTLGSLFGRKPKVVKAEEKQGPQVINGTCTHMAA